jgi:hypothetical protein
VPIPIEQLTARRRTVTIDEIGPLVFREPTLAEAQMSATNPYWWITTIECTDGTPFLTNPKEAGTIRADLAAALLAEVNRPRPTVAPSAGSGASQVPSNA